MYFPVADIEISPWIPLTVAFSISFFTSMGGVSGAFLLLPFQMSFLHFVSPAVSATNHIFNIVAIPSGVYRYIREGRMVWPLTWAIILGTMPGVLAGTYLRIQYLPDPTRFKRFAALVLLYIGIRLVRDIFASGRGQSAGSRRLPAVGDCRITEPSFSAKCIRFRFNEETYSVSTPLVLGLSLVIGIIGGIYGIGGGAIMAPFLISICGLPVHTIAGSALMGTLITSVVGVLYFYAIAPLFPNLIITPDWRLGLIFGLGGFLGMYCGARAQRYVPARLIKTILAFSILFTACRYLGIF